MMNYYEEFQETTKGLMAFAEGNEVIAAFTDLRGKACNDQGVLSYKVKELLGVAISVARECEPCIASHIGVAVKAGVTRQELIEALNVAVLLCGGAGWAYAAKALRAYDDFMAAQDYDDFMAANNGKA